MTDSAGQPWAGRHFEHNAASDDDGSAPEQLIAALRDFHAKTTTEAEVVDAIRGSRLLIPLIARLDAAGENEHGHTVDKSAELAIVTVLGPDGRTVLPAFSSVDTMRHWDPLARPVPADAVRVALAAASENTDLLVLDADSDSEFVVRRPALWAIGKGAPWTPSYLDAEVSLAFGVAARDEPAVVSLEVAPGDPDARLTGPELMVRLGLVAGLDRPTLDSVVARLRERWADDPVIAERVDSIGLTLVAAQ